MGDQVDNAAAPERIPMLNFVMLSLENASKAIMKPDITGNFNRKDEMVRLVQNTCQYQGCPHEDPHNHFMTFIKMYKIFIIKIYLTNM